MNNSIYLILVVLFLSACEGIKIDKEAGSRLAQISAVKESPYSEKRDSLWKRNDSIGIFMLKAGENIATATFRNIKYLSKGKQLLHSADVEIRFPFDLSNVDFIAYSPYRDKITDSELPINIQKQNNTPVIDLLYSNNVKDLNAKNPNVNLRLSYQFSKAIFRLRSNNLTLTSKNLKIKILNSITNAIFSLADGTISAPQTLGEIELGFKKKGKEGISEAVLIPTKSLTNISLEIAYKDNTYNIPLKTADITSFEKSKEYIFDISINDGDVSISSPIIINDRVRQTDTIADNSPDNNSDSAMVGDGTFDNPYVTTDAFLLKKAENVWVKGYIVGYAKSGPIYVLFPDGEVTTKTNIAIGLTEEETDKEKIIPIQLPKNQIREALNIAGHPDRLRKAVIVYGNINAYMKGIGVINLKKAFFDGHEVGK